MEKDRWIGLRHTELLRHDGVVHPTIELDPLQLLPLRVGGAVRDDGGARSPIQSCERFVGLRKGRHRLESVSSIALTDCIEQIIPIGAACPKRTRPALTTMLRACVLLRRTAGPLGPIEGNPDIVRGLEVGVTECRG